MTIRPTSAPERRFSTGLRVTVTAALVCLFALLVVGTATATAATRSTPQVSVPITDAERAIAALVGPEPRDALAILPRGFHQQFGYRPVVVDGRPVDPDGDCSSPVPLPTRFVPLCRSHDFGYDLLRYADASGHPAAPWARRALDDMLTGAMHDSCTNPLCHAAAVSSGAALTVNSWRQNWRAPVRETTADLVSSVGMHLLGALGGR